MIMILDVDVTAEGGITKLIARKGDTTTLGPKGRCPLSEATQPFYTTCGEAAPLFL